MSVRRILVVGTTPDYVARIRVDYPERAFFITDERWAAGSPQQGAPLDEIFCDLSDYPGSISCLKQFLANPSHSISGIACFDCESLELAATIAETLGWKFLSRDAARICRNKYLMREIWKKNRLPSPAAEVVYSQKDLLAFFDKTRGKLVLKPISGSGSEYVFMCDSPSDCSKALMTIKNRLTYPHDERMYPDNAETCPQYNPRTAFLAEEFVEGSEYSCDFVVDGNSTQLLRIAEKIPAVGQSFGTTLGYLIPPRLPAGFDPSELLTVAGSAARSVGVDRSICMLDFMVRDGKPVLIELSPRPGGDCIPDLLLWGGNFDILAYTLNFAEGLPCTAPNYMEWETHIGLRLLSSNEGTIQNMSPQAILADSRVREVKMKRGIGHRVVLPPYDYDSRILGHVIFRPNEDKSILEQCTEITERLRLNMREGTCRTPKAS